MSDGEKQSTKAMDKRLATRQQAVPSPKGSSSGVLDCKKDSGNGIGKQFNRPNGKKDFGGRPLVDARPAAVRTRGFDKRPKSRGYYASASKDEVTKVDGAGPEYGSVQDWGSKKGNLNHLLNFHFDPRDPYQQAVGYGGGRMLGRGWKGGGGGFRGGRWSGGRGSSLPYNKERFLQANCQFVVRDTGDYAVHNVDPDVLVDWDLIEQVRIFSHEVPTCPICLDTPRAAKMTRCGHIYCWTCLLHYLSLDDRSWRKCPICYEAVHEKDLKSVMALATHSYTAGQQLTMRLMKKSRGSTRAVPRSECEDRPLQSPCNIMDTRYTCYAKLLTADTSQVQEILDTERDALNRQLREEGEGTLEATFVTAAITLLKERETTLTAHKSHDNTLCDMIHAVTIPAVTERATCVPPAVTRDVTPVVTPAVPQVVTQYCCAFSDEEFDSTTDMSAVDTLAADEEVRVVNESGYHDDDSIADGDVAGDGAVVMLMKDGVAEVVAMETALEDMTLPDQDDEKPSGTKDDAFYFYQACDGQHMYMHALNVRCLVRQYGSLANCPDTITATVVELEAVSMDEELRRRLRYLSHLPLTCEFQMVELDLAPPLVTEHVLQLFAEELEKRRRTRQRKSRDDKRRARRIQDEENKKLGIDPTMRIVRSDYSAGLTPASHLSAPPPSVVTMVPSAMSDPTPPSPGSETGVWGSPHSSTSLEDAGTSSTMSFAQMLKAGKPKSSNDLLSWPRVSKPAGDVADGDRRHGDGVRRHSDSERAGSDVEDAGHVAPQFHVSFGDAIQAALDNYVEHTDASHNEDSTMSTQTGATTNVTPSGGKKKRTKKLLFSTSMARNK